MVSCCSAGQKVSSMPRSLQKVSSNLPLRRLPNRSGCDGASQSIGTSTAAKSAVLQLLQGSFHGPIHCELRIVSPLKSHLPHPAWEKSDEPGHQTWSRRCPSAGFATKFPPSTFTEGLVIWPLRHSWQLSFSATARVRPSAPLPARVFIKALLLGWLQRQWSLRTLWAKCCNSWSVISLRPSRPTWTSMAPKNEPARWSWW